MKPAPFSAGLTIRGEVACIRVAGEVDLATAPPVWRCVEQALAAGCCQILLDMGAVTFIDSTGLSIIIRCASRAGADNVTLRNPSLPVQRILDITHLARHVLVEYDDPVGDDVAVPDTVR